MIVAVTIWVIGYMFTLGFLMEIIREDSEKGFWWQVTMQILIAVAWPALLGGMVWCRFTDDESESESE